MGRRPFVAHDVLKALRTDKDSVRISLHLENLFMNVSATTLANLEIRSVNTVSAVRSAERKLTDERCRHFDRPPRCGFRRPHRHRQAGCNSCDPSPEIPNRPVHQLPLNAILARCAPSSILSGGVLSPAGAPLGFDVRLHRVALQRFGCQRSVLSLIPYHHDVMESIGEMNILHFVRWMFGASCPTDMHVLSPVKRA